MKMIKKTISLMLVLLIAAGIFSAASLTAFSVSTFTDGDFEYAILSDNTFSLYRYNGTDTALTLPEEYNGTVISGISGGCFEESAVVTVNIPNSYTFIGDSAFYGCASLKSVRIPGLIKSLGILAFAGCTSLESVDLSNIERSISIPEAFCNGDIKLTSIELPITITGIGRAAFSGTGLVSIEIPDSVKFIGNYAFSECAALESITLPDSLDTISENTFSDCTALTSIKCLAKLTAIGNSAFEGCTSLSDVDLNVKLTTIGDKAFYNAASLKNLFIPDSVTSIGADALAPMSYSKTIEVTCYENSYAAGYCYDNNVKNYTTIKKLIGDANADGEVTILDVTRIQKYRIGKAEIVAKELADINKDGDVTVRDATMIQMYIAKIIDEL